MDYNKDAPTTRTFFATVQNKLHFAVHSHTAAELIRKRADADQTNMGLTAWGKAPDGRILKADVAVAKNYLARGELESLGRISAQVAKRYAESEFEKYRVVQERRFRNDFDRQLEEEAKCIQGGGKDEFTS